MTIRMRQFGAAIWFSLLASLPFAVRADVVDGLVVGITDGDTLTLLVDQASEKTQLKIRLNAIDAPEKGQPFGTQALLTLGEICFQKHAKVTVVTVDRYGRSVGDVMCGNVDSNLEMVLRGMAWVYRKYAHASMYASLSGRRTGSLRAIWALG